MFIVFKKYVPFSKNKPVTLCQCLKAKKASTIKLYLLYAMSIAVSIAHIIALSYFLVYSFKGDVFLMLNAVYFLTLFLLFNLMHINRRTYKVASSLLIRGVTP